MQSLKLLSFQATRRGGDGEKALSEGKFFRCLAKVAEDPMRGAPLVTEAFRALAGTID